jgi:ribonuclease HI
MEQNISYVPRSAIKSQVLAYFVAEWTEIQTPQAPIEHETWIMYFGGSVTKEEAGAGLVFVLPLGVRMEYMVRLHFPASNNITEYESFINGLRIAVDLRIWHPEIRGDSELVIDQVMKEKNCVNPNMAAYCQAVRELEGKFHGLEHHHVLCDYNKATDILAKTASSRKPVLHGVFSSDQRTPFMRGRREAIRIRRAGGHGYRPTTRAKPRGPRLVLPHPEWLVEGKPPSYQT